MKYTIEKIRKTAERATAKKNKFRDDVHEDYSPQKFERVVERAVNRAMSDITKTISKEGMNIVPGGEQAIQKALTGILEGNIE